MSRCLNYILLLFFFNKIFFFQFLQLLVMGDGLSSDPRRGSRSDFPFSMPGRTTLGLNKIKIDLLIEFQTQPYQLWGRDGL